MNEQLIQGIEIDWDELSEDSYVSSIPAFNRLENLYFEQPITFFVGENGSGKSTLLEAMAIKYGFNPEGGTRNYCFSTHDSHSELCKAMHIVKGYRQPKWGYFLRAESFYNVATMEEEYAQWGRVASEELHLKSHGESFLALVQKHFQPNSIYFLDEPEAALSPQRQLTLLFEMDHLSKLGSQFFVVSHSPILLGIPNAEILTFDKGRIHSCTYEETDSYRVTKTFINNRSALLRELLDDEDSMW
jgi:predicted ATPase